MTNASTNGTAPAPQSEAPKPTPRPVTNGASGSAVRRAPVLDGRFGKKIDPQRPTSTTIGDYALVRSEIQYKAGRKQGLPASNRVDHVYALKKGEEPPQTATEQAKAAHPTGKRPLTAENKIDHFKNPEAVPKHAGKMPAAGRFHAEVPRLFDRKSDVHQKLHSGKRTIRAAQVATPPPYAPADENSRNQVEAPRPAKRRAASAPRTPSIFDDDRVTREQSAERHRGRRTPFRGPYQPIGGITPGHTPRNGSSDAGDGASTASAPRRRASPYKPETYQMAERLRMSAAPEDAEETPLNRKNSKTFQSSVGRLIGSSRGTLPVEPVQHSKQMTIKPFEPAPLEKKYHGPTKRFPVTVPYQSQIFKAEPNDGSGGCLYDYKFISNAMMHPEMAVNHSVPRHTPGRSSSVPTRRMSDTPMSATPGVAAGSVSRSSQQGLETPRSGRKLFERNNSRSSIQFG